jgi:hypothetical protein
MPKILREGRADEWLILTNGEQIKMSRVDRQNLMAGTGADLKPKRQKDYRNVLKSLTSDM